MNRAGLGLTLAVLTALPLKADGPALAHLTIDQRTITLTADAVPDLDTPHLTLTFAQHHLGFPLPPRLVVELENVGGTWTLTDFRLERGLGEPPLAFGTGAIRLSATAPTARQFAIEGEGLSPGAQMVPVHVEITLTSP